MNDHMGRLYEDVQELRGNVSNLIREVDSLKRTGSQPTLRDRFAMAALTGCMANPETARGLVEVMNQREGMKASAVLAEGAYKVADSMLTARGGAQ